MLVKRVVLNMVALAVIASGLPALLSSQRAFGLEAAFAEGGGTCCDQDGATCYINLGDGIIVKQPGAYYSSGSCAGGGGGGGDKPAT